MGLDEQEQIQIAQALPSERRCILVAKTEVKDIDS